MRPRTVYLVAATLLHAEKPMSARQIAAQIDRPRRSVLNVLLRLRRAGYVEIAEFVKPVGSRRVALFQWVMEGKRDGHAH